MIRAIGQTVLPTLTLDIDLRVGSEIVAVVGDNGVGKSTLLRVLAGLQTLSTGALHIDDIVVDEPATRTFVPPAHRGVAMLFQDPLLFPHLNVLDNVAFALRRSGTPRNDARTLARDALEQFAIAHLAQRAVSNLSGGEAQRVALARSLVRTPRAVLLDEPFSSLDRRSRADFRAMLKESFTELAVPTFIVTHDEADITALCGRTIHLERTTGFEPATLTLAR